MKKNLFSALYFTVFLALLYGTIFLFYYIIIKPDEVVSIFYSILYSYAHGFEFAFFIFIWGMIFIWLPKYIKLILYIFPAFLILLYFIIDISVFKQFRYNINLSMLQLFLGPASKEIFNFSTVMYVQFVIIVLFLMAVIIGLYFLSLKLSSKKLYPATISFFTLLFMVVLYHGIHAYAHHKNYLPIMKVAYILPQSYPLILKDLLAKYGIESASKQIEQVAINNMKYPLQFPKVGDNASKYNVVLIVIESWRFDSMTEEITPNIYNFSKDNLYFKNHNANANQTRHGLFSIFYGIPGNYWEAALYSGTTPVLMDMFQNENYQLGIFASSALTSPEFDRTIFAKVKNLRTHTEAPTPNKRDVKITEEFTEFLNNIDKNKPFFGFLFYDTPHSYSFDSNVYPPKFTPYSGSKNYINTSNDERELLFNLYKNSVGYTDILVGNVLNTLKDKGFLEDTIVIITGDHAEEFNDLGKNYWGHFGNYSRYQTEVPFIVHIPNVEANTYEYETSHMDIVPTIMKHVFNSPTPVGDYSIGYDILDNTTRPYIFIKGEEYAIKYNDKYIIMKKYGLPEIRDLSYNIINEDFDGKIIHQVLEQLKKYRN